MIHANLRIAFIAGACLLFTACATVTHTPPGTLPESEQGAAPTSPPAVEYASERDAAEVAQLRAAPAPERASIAVGGNNPSADDSRMATQGFTRIGSGRYRGDEAFARAEAERQSVAVGAERVLLYAPADAIDGVWTATYYVRFRLAFGATFRDLRADERATLGGRGGVQIGTVMGGTPASRANLLAGDYVTAVNGRAIADKIAFQDALRANVGRNVTLTIVRNGETLPRVVRMGGGSAGADKP